MQSLKDKFLLNPDIHYLNFGSFGACPKPVFENYQHWQRVLEYEPVQFMNVNGPQYLADSRAALANYLDIDDKDDLVYITNPTLGVNIIAKNLSLSPGDEVLTTDLEYGACDRTYDLFCQKANAVYKRQKIRLPVTTKEDFISNFFEGLSRNTKAIFISQITASTALILPVKEIVATAKEKGLITIVDGAHAPGHIPVSIKDINPDFYTGACHKWMMAPKGSSFLYANKSAQQILKEPLIVSWGYKAIKPSGSTFIDYNQMIGTRDFSAFLTVPAAINFMKENNWTMVASNCADMAISFAPNLFNLLDTEPISPLTKEWIGQMISIPIKTNQPEELQRILFTNYNIEVPLMRHPNKVLLRYSINAFNAIQDLEALSHALETLKDKFIL